MPVFTTLRSKIVPLPMNDVDTDQIIPARFLKVIDKEGLGKHLFSDWRYLSDGSEKKDFILNAPECKGAQVLLAGDNFACGSSREHAPWALTAWGFRAVLSTSFADIFRNNALKNALVPIVIDSKVHAKLFEMRAKDAAVEVTVDLETQSLGLPDGSKVIFPIDSFSKHCLLHGIDELGYLLSFEEQIVAHEDKQP